MKFHTGYLLSFNSKEFTPKEYSDVFIINTNQRLIPKNYKGNNWNIDWKYNTEFNGLEFIIEAETTETAINILYNVFCSATVYDGTNYSLGEPHFPHALGSLEKIEYKGLLNLQRKPVTAFISSVIPNYFYLAAKASIDNELQNAIIKYQLSTEIYSQHAMDLHEVIEWKSTNYNYIQMRFAYAIITAYGVIEELGLEIRASRDNPSILANGEWNPKVLDNLIERLKKSHINVRDDIAWLIRGEETEFEKSKLRISKKAEWSDSPEYENYFFISINDGYVYIPDAINYISYLRSSIASHCVGERIMGLSVFDVGNAQFLARRLILERMKLWK